MKSKLDTILNIAALLLILAALILLFEVATI